MRQNGRETRRKILQASVWLFLEKGYHGATVRDICKMAGVLPGSFQNAFGSKDGVLFELVQRMYNSQFDTAARLLGDKATPVLEYALETSIQIALTEISPKLREIYVEAYTQQRTMDYICEKTPRDLMRIFAVNFPGDDSEADFYEREIGSSGLMRAYMAKPCDTYFTMERKIRRFLEMSLDEYRVPRKEQQDAIETILHMDLLQIARNAVDELIQVLKNELEDPNPVSRQKAEDAGL